MVGIFLGKLRLIFQYFTQFPKTPFWKTYNFTLRDYLEKLIICLDEHINIVESYILTINESPSHQKTYVGIFHQILNCVCI